MKTNIQRQRVPDNKRELERVAQQGNTKALATILRRFDGSGPQIVENIEGYSKNTSHVKMLGEYQQRSTDYPVRVQSGVKIDKAKKVMNTLAAGTQYI